MHFLRFSIIFKQLKLHICGNISIPNMSMKYFNEHICWDDYRNRVPEKK